MMQFGKMHERGMKEDGCRRGKTDGGAEQALGGMCGGLLLILFWAARRAVVQMLSACLQGTTFARNVWCRVEGCEHRIRVFYVDGSPPMQRLKPFRGFCQVSWVLSSFVGAR